MQSERWANIGREILFSARSELYMNLAVSRRRTRGAAGAGRLRDELARDRCKDAVFQRRVACARFERAARASTAPICTRSFTVCCAIRRKCAAATAISVARVRHCGRKPARQSGYRCLAPDKTSVRPAQPLPLAARHMPVLIS